MKKKTVAFVICIFLIVALFIVYIFSELYTESDITTNNENLVTDSMKFKKEYEEINNKPTTTGKTVREINIIDDNRIVYTTEDELISMIDSEQSFIVYFGFAECPWCRSVIENFINTAKENNIDKIYYLDVLNIRDKYELDSNNKAVRTQEGTAGYYTLLSKLSNVLSEYKPLTYTNSKGKEKKVTIDEKRIYAPNFVLVQKGVATMMTTGISPKVEDPYMELTSEIIEYQKTEFEKMFQTYNKNLVVSTCADTMC